MRTLQNSELLQVCGGTGAPSGGTSIGPISVGPSPANGGSGNVNLGGSVGPFSGAISWNPANGNVNVGGQYATSLGNGLFSMTVNTSDGGKVTLVFKIKFD